MVRWTLFTLCLVAQFSVVAGADDRPPGTYSAKEITATVVDDEHEQPLEGVIVVAQWVLYVAGLGHGGHGPRLHVAEAVTDSAGRLHFPGWGPKPNPRYPFSRLVNRDPVLSFFKPGYHPRLVQNRWAANETVRVSEWDGKTIRLKRFAGNDTAWARELRNFQGRGWLAWDEDYVDWRLMPRMVLELELQRLELEKKRVSAQVSPSPLRYLRTTVDQVREFLERRP
ncbi:MAG: hypothetical protein ACREKS_00275 [Candidatus Rokuibacteriota bacterium]